MKKLFSILLLATYTLFSQSETELININYSHHTNSDYNEGVYTSSLKKIDFALTYGHSIGKKSNLFYYASYENFNRDTQINNTTTLIPSIPNYEIVSFAFGMKNELKKQWNLTNFITYTLVDDFKKNTLSKTNYYRSFSFISKSKTSDFSYGIGVFTSKIGENFSILPIVQFKYQNKKRGVKLFFPRNLKFWQVINNTSYVSLKTKLDLNLLQYVNTNISVTNNSIVSNLAYNYIYHKKFKVTAGLGLPIYLYNYTINSVEKTTSQIGGLRFSIGLSFVVFPKDK